MSAVANLAVASFLVIAATLAFLAWRAWRETASPRLAWVLTAFGLFALKGALFSWLLFSEPTWQETAMVPGIALDILALGAFYMAAFRRG